MSEFDKEKEREKLREKYGQEEQKRQATEQMSELLLKGATMTNRHCEECGDPVFRYDGQEFCPTCQAPATEEEQAPESGEAGGSHEQGRGASTADTGGDAADPQAATGERAQSPDASGQDRSPDAGARDRTPEPRARSADPDPASAGQRGRTPDRSATYPDETGEPGQDRQPRSAPDRRQPARSDTGDADPAAAAASLRRTLAHFARQAEATDDPSAAREHLRAAREAAEALAALRR